MPALHTNSLSALVLAIGLSTAAAASPAPSGVGGEVARLRQMVTATQIEDEAWPRLRQRLVERLDAIAAEIQAGRNLAALDRLSDTRNDLLAHVYRTEWREAGFAPAWNRQSVAPVSRVDPTSPAAIRALAEAAHRRARSYLSASQPYAEATSAESGLFYLGRARAHADFVDLCNRLGAGRQLGQPPPARALDAELASLERRIVVAYLPPLSIDRHGDFIELHATLKLAEELAESSAYLGALYQYVDATVRLAQILTPHSGPDRRTLLLKATEYEEGFDRGTVDHGIGRMFLERAQGALARTREEGPKEDELALAWAVLEHGLPAYLEALRPVEGRRDPGRPAVTVTLVRWPYT